MAKHFLYTYDRCTDRNHMVEGITLTSNRHILHYNSDEFVISPLWTLIGSSNRKEDKKYQINIIRNIQDLNQHDNTITFGKIRKDDNACYDMERWLDEMFKSGGRTFGFSKKGLAFLLWDDKYNSYVGTTLENGTVGVEKLKTKDIDSLLVVPCGYSEDIVYQKETSTSKKLVSDKYGTSCSIDFVKGYNEEFIYYMRGGHLYVTRFDLADKTNLDTVIKKSKNKEPYYIDFSEDIVYYKFDDEQVIRGYDLSGACVDEWKIPEMDSDEVLMFVGKHLFIIRGRISGNDDVIQDGYVFEYNREGVRIGFSVIDEGFGWANGTCVDYIAGEPCVLGKYGKRYGMIGAVSKIPAFNYMDMDMDR